MASYQVFTNQRAMATIVFRIGDEGQVLQIGAALCHRGDHKTRPDRWDVGTGFSEAISDMIDVHPSMNQSMDIQIRLEKGVPPEQFREYATRIRSQMDKPMKGNSANIPR